MLKLKSLFRRGQAPAVPSASGGASGKQHSGSNNNRNKSQSTTSLNSAVENEQQQAAAAAAAAQFYAINQASERAVDVGDAQLNNIAATAEQLQSNTLPQPKKTKATKTKGLKQPKQLPTPKAATAAAAASNSNSSEQQQTVINSTATAPATVAAGNAAANVMTTIAAVPVGQNSTLPTSHLAATAAANNNYTAETVVAPSPAATALALQDCNDLYKLNAAIAGNYQQYISSNNEQQQQLLEAKTKMQELQTQMERMGHEKLLLESRVAELLPYQHEVTNLKTELLKMQSQYEKSQMEIGHLKYENESLRNRLRDVVNSPLSDTEKHQIIQDSQRLHSSAPASIAVPSSTNSNSITTTNTSTSAAAESDACTPCLTPDWDKHSSSSEISVACLQDKIIQMEETHYSTNEELQATLQELADLQTQLADTQTENERLAEEKDVLFQSLCRQTEKLNETRTQINTLQELLLRDAKQAELGNSERENKLLELIKTSQEERENVLVKQEELNAELQELRQSVEAADTENKRFRDRIALLDSTLDAANAERKQTEAQLLQAKEEISQRAIEMSRLSTLLDNARSKIDELEQDLARGEKTDLSELLDAARKEKDALEERVAELQDQCSRSQAEIRRLKDQLQGLTEECKVAKNNAKCAVSHLEYRLEQLQHEKDKQSADYQQLVESTAELQVQSKFQQEDKTQLQKLLGKTQQQLGDMESKLQETQEQLDKETQLRKQEAEEWQQFQSDLLMTVRVANDFKTEALSAREQLVVDNKTAKDKIRLLEQQIEKLAKQQMQQTETQQSVLSSVQQEMASRRNKIGSSLNRQDSRLSVKTLIESIESNSQAQSGKAEETEESHYSSTSSLNSAHTPEISTNMLPPPFNNVGSNNITNEWSDHVRLSTTAVSNSANAPATLSSNAKGPLREQQQQQQQQTLVSNMHFSSLNNVSKPLLSGERKDPLNMLAKNGGSKRNALLKWCQNKTVGYRNIDITNFSSSWNDGLALSAILHSYLPDHIPYDTLSPANKRRNFSLAFAAAESVGIPTTLNINDMCQLERPDWTQVMTYVTAIYKHFEM